MLDLKDLRKDPQGFETKLKNKVSDVTLSPILALDERLRALKTEAEEMKSKRNHSSKEIGMKKQKGEDVTTFMAEMNALNDRITHKDHEIVKVETELQGALSILPNLPMDDVPISPSPKDNVCIKEFGQKPTFDFPFKNHVELNEKLHLFDFARGAKISGSGWPLYVGMGARLEWALDQLHARHPSE